MFASPVLVQIRGTSDCILEAASGLSGREHRVPHFGRGLALNVQTFQPNCLLRIRCISWMPAMAIVACRKLLKPSIAAMRCFIPTLVDQNPYAQSLRPTDMIVHGWAMSLFQASQQWSRMFV